MSYLNPYWVKFKSSPLITRIKNNDFMKGMIINFIIGILMKPHSIFLILNFSNINNRDPRSLSQIKEAYNMGSNLQKSIRLEMIKDQSLTMNDSNAD
jgi:hypothetical protein